MAPTRGAFGRRKAYRPVSRILFAPCVAPLPLIWAVGHPTALSAYPLAQTSRLQAPAYMAFHPARFTKPSELLLTLVGSYPTFSPLLRHGLWPAPERFYFLWHFPSAGLTTPLPTCIPGSKSRVTRHLALWSSDFPLPVFTKSDPPPFQNRSHPMVGKSE